MKVTKLEIKNIGLIAETTIEFNKPLLLFFGEIRQGKTTLLNSIKWLLGSPWPSDIIRHGASEASITLTLDTGVISRSWYVAKNGKETKARDIVFVLNGRPVGRPASEIGRLLNPFLLDQNFLVKMGEAERKKYFSELFAVDTTAMDKELVEKEMQASNLRAAIRAYGDIDLTRVPESKKAALLDQIAKLKDERALERKKLQDRMVKLKEEHAEARKTIDSQNEAARDQNAKNSRLTMLVQSLKDEIARLTEKLAGAEKELAATPLLVLHPLPEPPAEISQLLEKVMAMTEDTPEMLAIREQIKEDGLNDVRREQFEKNQARAREKAAKESQLESIELRVRQLRKDKLAKLSEVTENIKIKGLAFDQDGTFSYQGTQAGMLSTSELMRLSSELSALYPEGFGLELIDRGESLGKSIFEFVEKAEKEKSTILATIVGESPAETPAGVGVFVVEDGKVTPKATKQTELI